MQSDQITRPCECVRCTGRSAQQEAAGQRPEAFECGRCGATFVSQSGADAHAIQCATASKSPEVLASYRGKAPPAPDAAPYPCDANEECPRCSGDRARAAQEAAASGVTTQGRYSGGHSRPLVEQGRAVLEGLGQMNAAAHAHERMQHEARSAQAGANSPPPAERTFTRAEVLAVLKTFRAIAPSVDPTGEREKAAADIAAIFGER